MSDAAKVQVKETNKEKGEAPAPKKKPRGKVFIRPEWCKGCGFCVEFCPTHVLVLAEGFNAKGYHPPEVCHPENCTACNLCAMYCPEFAIWSEKVKEEEDKEKK